MYRRPQRHHYETSKKAKITSAFAGIITFILIMFYFTIIRGRPFDSAFTNRALAITAVFMIGFSYILGPLARFFSRTFVKYLEYRKPLGLYGYFIAVAHILLSLLIVPGDVFGSNGVSLFFAMISIIIFTMVASTSLVKSIETFGFERWQKIQRMGYLAFFLVILHFSVLEGGQFIGRQLGQITLLFASLVLLARITALFVKQKMK